MRIKEKDVIRYALRVLAEHITTGYDANEEISKEDKKWLRKIDLMLPKYNG